MKIMVAVLFVATMLILGFFIFQYSSTGNSKFEEPWNPVTPDGSVSGIWGTTIEVEFDDGTIETLHDAFTLDISFNGKKVSAFKYILFSKVASETYTNVALDLTSFYISSDVTSQSLNSLGSDYGEDIITIPVNDDWTEVYRIIVDEDELGSLDAEASYNLTFIPSGIIQYCGSGSTVWNDVPPPDPYWIEFRVTDYVDGKHIEIGFSGEGL